MPRPGDQDLGPKTPKSVTGQDGTTTTPLPQGIPEMPEMLDPPPQFDRVANAIGVLKLDMRDNTVAIVEALDRLSAATLAARLVGPDDSVEAMQTAVSIASRALGLEG